MRKILTIYFVILVSNSCLGNSINWSVLQNISVSAGTLTKTSATNAWNSEAFSSSVLSSKVDGSAQFTVANTVFPIKLAFGFSVSDPNKNPTNIDYYFNLTFIVLNTPRIRVFKGADMVGEYGTYQVGDVMKIERIGNILYFKKNNNILTSF